MPASVRKSVIKEEKCQQKSSRPAVFVKSAGVIQPDSPLDEDDLHCANSKQHNTLNDGPPLHS